MHSLALPVIAAAEGASGAVANFDLESVLSQGVTTVQGYIFTTLGIVVPAIVTCLGIIVAVNFGLRWLKKLGRG